MGQTQGIKLGIYVHRGGREQLKCVWDKYLNTYTQFVGKRLKKRTIEPENFLKINFCGV